MRPDYRPERDKTQLLVVDIQQRLTPSIADGDTVVAQIVRMCRAAREFELPITVTEQYPQGLGCTVPAVTAVTEDATKLEKTTFSVWRDDACRERLKSLDRPHVLVVGVETHVCVQQTAFDLHEAQMTPFVLADACGSSRPLDYQTALRGMRQIGVNITTVESVIFELLKSSGTKLFKRLLPIIK